MHDFDESIKSMAAKEPIEVPDFVKNRIEQTLSGLPEKRPAAKHMRLLPRVATAAACFVFITLFLLPNISTSYAGVLQQIPVIGDIVRVVTIRNYFYADNRHEMDIDVPKIEGDDAAAGQINEEVSQLTAALVSQFYKDLEITASSGYGSIHVDYQIVTNTERWFTLQLTVNETEASSNSYYVFYHIDKQSGQIIELGDLFIDDTFSDLLTQEIQRQMQKRMDADETVKYFLSQNSEIGEAFTSVGKEQNFYLNRPGQLVIIFDKYEVAPGSMGTPAFVIGKDVIADILKPEFADMIS